MGSRRRDALADAGSGHAAVASFQRAASSTARHQEDADAALATMTENPYVLLIPAGTGGTGRAAVREFYANHFLPNIPPDFELISLSQTFGNDRIVEEFVISFTHSLDMDWMLPGMPATGRRVEFAFVGLIQFQDGKVAHEHLYWDQATLLSQMGVLDHPLAAAGVGSAGPLWRGQCPR